VAKLEQKELIDLLRQMLLIRRFEEKCAEMYALGKIGGFLHLYIGEEAVAVGAISVLRPDDYAIAGYREHGHALAKGSDPGKVMAEMFGRADGLCKGKGGSMHLFDKARNFLGGHAIVAGQIPIGTGAAFASKYEGKDQVTLCFFGDGAVNQGVFHEALNLAALWHLPIVYICENNRYGMGTSVDRATSVTHLYRRAEAYGMPGEAVDGMDVLAVRERVGLAVDRARRDCIPSFIEAETYRFRGHSMADPGTYRTKDEVEEQKKHDPVFLFRDRLTADGVLKESDWKQLEREVRDIVEGAVRYADASPEPPLEWLLTDVYVSER
jgi:pyruvate dehydrogenase E1 component alpha subunit